MRYTVDVNDAFYEHTLFGFDIMISSKEGDMLVVNTDEELCNLFLAVETFQLLQNFCLPTMGAQKLLIVWNFLFLNSEVCCFFLYQLVEGLTFLHNDAKILQASLAPELICVTKNGQWKIAGLFFSSTPVVIDGQVQYMTVWLFFCCQLQANLKFTTFS